MIFRGKIVTSGGRGIIEDGILATQKEKITWVGEATDFPSEIGDLPAKTDLIILPGLIDVHCHGGAGHDFSELDLSGIKQAAGYHRSQGTTTVVASLVSASMAMLQQQIESLSAAVDLDYIKGIHLEGPFISKIRKGAQNPDFITAGDPKQLANILENAVGKIVSMTIAPETANFQECIEVLNNYRVVPSLGHTTATNELASEFISQLNGSEKITITHLFNGMNPLHHRDPGMVAAAIKGMFQKKVVGELINDGIHLSPEIVNFVFSICPPDQIMFVSDAMAAAGMPDGNYKLGVLETTVVDGVARLATSDGSLGAIAGGTSHILAEVKQAVEKCGIPLKEAVASATIVPATTFGWRDRGSLAIGKRADLVVVDKKFKVQSVIAGGKEWK